jgi:nucleoside-diphosphate-sugar epimerase
MLGKVILVTGGLGHIGSALIRGFGPDVAEVRIIDNLLTQRYASLFDLPDSPRVVFYEEDIMTADLAKRLEGAHAVIHLAAITNAEATVGKEAETEEVNYRGLVRVADACEAAGVRLLFPSSTSVYGSQAAVVDETSTELAPQSPYADSKLKAEAYLAGKKGSGLRSITCRFGTIFGWSIGMRFHTAVNKFTWQAVNGKPITVWRTAWEQKRPYLGLDDCVRSINFILDTDLFDGEIYNIVTKNFTVKDIVETIKEFIPSLEVGYVDSKIMNQLSYDVDASKIAKKGFTPTADLKTGIGTTVERLAGVTR